MARLLGKYQSKIQDDHCIGRSGTEVGGDCAAKTLASTPSNLVNSLQQQYAFRLHTAYYLEPFFLSLLKQHNTSIPTIDSDSLPRRVSKCTQKA